MTGVARARVTAVIGRAGAPLADLPANTPLDRLAATVNVHRVREQAHRQPEVERGLDRFAGRSLSCLHRRVLIVPPSPACRTYALR
jgi:hypothetical protein